MRKRRSENDGFNVWRSYSDMMAGVLLLFVLIMCVTLFQAQQSYDESIQERDEKLALQKQYTSEILAQQTELDAKDGQLKSQDERLKTQEEILIEQKAQLDALAAQLADQEKTLDKQKSALEEKTNLLKTQQAKIDNIIGVKADVIESLQNEFKKNNVTVNIDSQSGAMTLESNVLFGTDEAELTEESLTVLRSVLPIYCKVLLEKKHQPYLAEIIIDGYTDTNRDYDYNLELSQRRSLAVAQYLLEIAPEFLDEQGCADLKDHLTVNGHSMSNPILDANGNVDMDASRRVEVKFRLKDEEMIQELNSILTAE